MIKELIKFFFFRLPTIILNSICFIVFDNSNIIAVTYELGKRRKKKKTKDKSKYLKEYLKRCYKQVNKEEG